MENLLTLSRIILTFPVVLFILSGNYYLALFLYILGALTDWFDGNIARKNRKISNTGKLFDPYADKVFVLLPLIALVETGRVKSIWVILLTFRELSISFLRSLAVERGIYMEASLLGKLKAFFEFLSVILILAGFEFGNKLLILSVILAYLSALEYVKNFRKLSA